MSHDFRLYFNRKRQWSEVYLHDVHPNTFHKGGGGRWGYFTPVRKNSRSGSFGELHFVKRRLRYDLIVHELFHLAVDYVWSKGQVIDRRNEEKMAEFMDGLVRNFVRELRKIDPEVKL